MQFASIRACLGWAFQIEATLILKTAKHGESTGPAWGGMSPHDEHAQASMVMAKVNRLPVLERTAVWAYYVAAREHSMAMADSILPEKWPLKLRQELAAGWANDRQLKRDQKQMAGDYGISEDTMTRRKKEAYRLLDGVLDKAETVLELQLLNLIRSPSRKNNARTPCHGFADCV